jgi:superfamily II DNA helicase RecQ
MRETNNTASEVTNSFELDSNIMTPRDIFEPETASYIPLPMKAIDAARSSTVPCPPKQSTQVVSPALNALKRLYGAECSWRSAEKEAVIEEALEVLPQEGLLAILPTGFGKSLLFLIPALIAAPKVVCVFLPLKALLDSCAQQLRAKGIPCTVWGEQPTRNPRVESLLLISSDCMSTSDTLRVFLRRLERENRLDRFVVDECHLLLSAEFRAHRLQDLRKIRDFNCPIIMLTATLPPHMQPELLNLMMFTTENCRVWRLPSARPNLLITIFRPKTLKEAENWLYGTDLPPGKRSFMEKARLVLDPNDKGIIYTLTKAEAEEVGQQLGIPVHHSGIQDKRKILDTWLNTEQQWIIGTSGLGAGLDVPNVKVVLNWGMPPDVIKWTQMCGRAGRGLPMAQVVVIEPQERPRSRQRLWEQAATIHHDRVAVMEIVISRKPCIRFTVGKYLDGEAQAKTCSELNAQNCSYCRIKEVNHVPLEFCFPV